MKKRFTLVQASKISLHFLLFALLSGYAGIVSGQQLISHDFDNGQLLPFLIDQAQDSRVKVIDKVIRTQWKEENYDGSNYGRKAQFTPKQGTDVFKQEFWLGFRIKVHSDYMANDYDSDAGLMQIWGFNDAAGSANHYAMLKFEGRNGGGMVWAHRYQHGKPTNYLVQGDFPRDEFVKVVVHIKLSSLGSIVQIWLNDELKVDKSNQNMGWGDMNADGQYNQSYSLGASLGQYNFRPFGTSDYTHDSDDHYFKGHLQGEVRTVSYDNVSMYYDGADGYEIVDPDQMSTTPSCASVNAFTRIEAEDYCTMTGIHHQETDIGSINDGDWVAFDTVDFGNGANNIEARVASNTPGGIIEVRLEEVTGPLIGILDVGNTGGWDAWKTIATPLIPVTGKQAVYFVFKGSGNGLFDIDWLQFEEVSLSTAPLHTLDQYVHSYPNPVSEQLFLKKNIALAGPLEIYLLNLKGQILYQKCILNTDDCAIDMRSQKSGIYLLRMIYQGQTQTRKLIKI